MNTYYRRLGPLEDAPSNAIRVKRVDVELPVVFTLVPADIENTPEFQVLKASDGALQMINEKRRQEILSLLQTKEKE